MEVDMSLLAVDFEHSEGGHFHFRLDISLFASSDRRYTRQIQSFRTPIRKSFESFLDMPYTSSVFPVHSVKVRLVVSALEKILKFACVTAINIRFYG